MKFDINKYDVISFDLFDTLVKRKVSLPSDIFDLVEEEFYELYNKRINNFKIKRISAERKAREKGDIEITIDEIYNNLEIELSKDKKEILKNMEKKVEIKSCFVNDECIKILEKAKYLDKKIVITTDMYLDEETIKEILKCNNIYYDKLFLSSSLNKTKSNGSLFKYIRKQFPHCKIMHIGDNFKSDYIMARLNGIKGYYYKRK